MGVIHTKYDHFLPTQQKLYIVTTIVPNWHFKKKTGSVPHCTAIPGRFELINNFVEI